MITYPPPEFEQQKSEILQRYKILRGDSAHDAVCLADTISSALRVPVVHAAVYKKYQERYRCSHGLCDYPEEDVEMFFALTHLAQGQFNATDIQTEEYFHAQTCDLNVPEFHALAGIPLTDPHGKRFGTLCIADEQVREFGANELQMLSGFARVVSNDICIRSAAHYAVGDLLKLEKEKCELFELATIDPLTKALNRRSFEKFSNREVARMKREKLNLATLMIDIDHFKAVNDQYGHAVGDQVIAKLVSVITKCVRQEDLVGRLGGEEFAVVLVDANASQAEIVGNRIRNTIKQFEFPGGSGPFSIACSIGVSEPTPYDEDIQDSLQRADEALYEAKKTGRDKVVVNHRAPSAPNTPIEQPTEQRITLR